jgi:hypothetical protein
VKKFKLVGMETEIDWQLAYEASKHAEKNKRNVLIFETPNGDVAMSVQKLGNVTQITKLK